MKKGLKVFLGLLVVLILLFASYAYKYHSLAMEAWRLFNVRCNNVNPLYIKTRDQHLYLSQVMAGEVEMENPENLIPEIKNLITYSDNYLEAENKWLDSQSKYLNRWDTQLIEPDYIKRAGNYQIMMYEAQYNYYKTVSDFFSPLLAEEQSKPENSDTVIDDLDKYASDMQEYRKLYFEAFEEGQNKQDWKKTFGQVPEPDCAEENLI